MKLKLLEFMVIINLLIPPGEIMALEPQMVPATDFT